MPQMAPLSWLMLFFIFNLIFIMINLINFYSFIYKPKIILFKKKMFLINWKW